MAKSQMTRAPRLKTLTEPWKRMSDQDHPINNRLIHSCHLLEAGQGEGLEAWPLFLAEHNQPVSTPWQCQQCTNHRLRTTCTMLDRTVPDRLRHGIGYSTCIQSRHRPRRNRGRRSSRTASEPSWPLSSARSASVSWYME